MAVPRPPDPVKVVAAILWSPAADLDALKERIARTWGRIDFEGPDRPFVVTEYYAPEMGLDLKRRLVSIDVLVAPEDLIELKRQANAMEDACSGVRGRLVNIDVGYLDYHKLVLGSGKFDAQKIHLGDGIYADIVCRYSEGKFHPYEWTFPDFRERLYDDELLAMRRLYKAQLRILRAGSDVV